MLNKNVAIENTNNLIPVAALRISGADNSSIDYNNVKNNGIKFDSACLFITCISSALSNFYRLDVNIPDDVLNSDFFTKELKENEFFKMYFVVRYKEKDELFYALVDSMPVKGYDAGRKVKSYVSFYDVNVFGTDDGCKYDLSRIKDAGSHELAALNKDAVDYAIKKCNEICVFEEIKKEQKFSADKIKKSILSNASKLFSDKKGDLNDITVQSKLKKTKNKNSESNESVMKPATTSESIFNKSSLKKYIGSDNPMDDMNALVGLNSVKDEILRFYAAYKFDKERGISISKDSSMHMCFMGNPGTGKTTVARIMAGILYEMGYTQKNQCIEINALQMMGNYVGQTGVIVSEILKEAAGGVLFIDEAYSLAFQGSSYGSEAVSVLLKEMEDNRSNIAVILAGYEGPMNKFLDMNSGFRSRINHYFKFENYNVNQLVDIFVGQMKNHHLKAEESVLNTFVAVAEKEMNKKEFGNGRFVRNMLEKFEEKHMINCVQLYGAGNNVEITKNVSERIDTLTREDIPANIDKM